ncbi:hypothetical protein SAMN02745123_01433 [Desulforamulus aeronauticus DSM 10349]|uniref:FlgN protein n=2 Tax=Desulforamulus aeronauticus TaxID=53343 RepID=A0A1M6RDB0_9FIRM|nr:hypothetical protein SAMN02745123_01433 [Desulforamulus aeronauticus DSM 10349]
MQAMDKLYLDKKAAVQKMLETTIEMSKDISDEDVNNLDMHLAKRQELMSKIDEIDREITLLEAPESEQVKNIKTEIKGMIKEIIDYDVRYKESLSRAQFLMKQKLKEVKTGRVINQAYYPQQKQNNGYFIDNKK